MSEINNLLDEYYVAALYQNNHETIKQRILDKFADLEEVAENNGKLTLEQAAELRKLYEQRDALRFQNQNSEVYGAKILI